jgi:hypothetical protein
MLLHIDGSRHRWFGDQRGYDLLAILDDATSEIYYAQLVEEESTRTVLAGIRGVVERKGVFCAMYSDRASHFFVTPKAGGPVDRSRLTQVGRALKDLGTELIPAYSPQARGRSERSFRTWQGRLPQELRVRAITERQQANEFLREHYIAEFNQRFQVPAEQRGSAFAPAPRRNLDQVFALQQERVVNRDNTVQIGNRVLPIAQTRWRATLAGCRVMVYEHLDGATSIGYGPHVVARFAPDGLPERKESPKNRKGCGKAALLETVEKSQSRTFPPFPQGLEIPQTARDSHFPTATTTTVSL